MQISSSPKILTLSQELRRPNFGEVGERKQLNENKIQTLVIVSSSLWEAVFLCPRFATASQERSGANAYALFMALNLIDVRSFIMERSCEESSRFGSKRLFEKATPNKIVASWLR